MKGGQEYPSYISEKQTVPLDCSVLEPTAFGKVKGVTEC